MATSRKDTEELIHLSLDGKTIPVTVRRRKRQKYIRLRISGNGEVTISGPKHSTKKRLREALSEKRNWVSRQLEKIDLQMNESNPLQQIYFNGKAYPVRIDYGPNARISVGLSEDKGLIHVHLPQSYYDMEDVSRSGEIKDSLAGWLHREASQHFHTRAREVAEEIDTPFRKLFIRNQKTRWGSSSSIGNISLNWRAIMAPPEVQRYLIIHELVHQHQLNHSTHFWRLVSHYCPDYRKHEQWLKDHRELMALFR